MLMEIKSICCIGAGYVGGPTMAVIADYCPEIKVTVVDLNTEKINAWNSKDLKKLPVYETGLEEIVKSKRNKNLFFCTNLEKGIKEADMIFLAVNTPTKTSGLGKGEASDIKWVENAARQIAKYAEGETIIVEKSTVPVRTASTIEIILNSFTIEKNLMKAQKSFFVLSNPEFLSEGNAISDLRNPDRVLIGGKDKEAIKSLISIYSKWIDKDKIITTNVWSSELSKLTANAFLSQRISSINSISAICEKTGADIKEVSKAIGMDKRVGSEFLQCGPGFGGSCFKKDLLNLIYLANFYGLKEVAEYWKAVININTWQQNRITSVIFEKMFGNLSNKKISIFGFSFKANTNDTRESPAMYICKDLLEEGAFLKIFDPKVDRDKIYKDFNNIELKKGFSNWEVYKNYLDACQDSDAIVILTEWSEFKNLDWIEIRNKMNKPAWLFDTRNISNKKQALEVGIKTWHIGQENT